MTNSNYPPSGIHPIHWARIKAQRKRLLKTQIAALYRLDPVLWAVTKGYDTPTKIATKLNWSPTRTSTAIQRATQNNLIKPRSNKLRPARDEHKILRRRYLR